MEGERTINGERVDWMPADDNPPDTIGVWMCDGAEPVGQIRPYGTGYMAEAYFGPPGFSAETTTFDEAVDALVANARRSCPECGLLGSHKMGCSRGGAKCLTFTARRRDDGTFEVPR